MKSVLHMIRILVIFTYVVNSSCQDPFSGQDILRLQQIASNDGQMETITSYSTNILQRDPSSQSMSSVSVQYQLAEDDKNNDFHRTDRSRSKKVYRIKNPFQQQLTENERQQDSTETQDTDIGASNQYTSMQYSLPPEEFLQQLRAQNQFYQQSQQHSTPAPMLSYTATPQPYAYPKLPSNYENQQNQQEKQLPKVESKASHPQQYSNSEPYNYNGVNNYYENIQSTPSPVPPFLSTINNQISGTQQEPYVSSSAPLLLSSPSNIQQYVSSPLSPAQPGTSDYNNRVTSTIGSNSLNYENNGQNSKIQIDHYDNSANGVRYPSMLQQFQNEYPSSTPGPSPTTSYPDPVRDSWQNAVNAGVNSLAKSLHDFSMSQYQNYQYNQNQADQRPDYNDNSNSETHRIGNAASANNVFMQYVQPDFNTINNQKTRTRDLNQDLAQPEYSHGDYGWKMQPKKPPVTNNDAYASSNYPRAQASPLISDVPAVSHMNFQMDVGRQYQFDNNPLSKSATESIDTEFAKAAARAHESLKQQYLYGGYANHYNNNPQYGNYFANSEKPKAKIVSENQFSFSSSQPDLITASPYYYSSKDNSIDGRVKQPFDHARALKNIVPIDATNVLPNSDGLQKSTGQEINGKYNSPDYNKDQMMQQIKQYYKPITDAYYRDKNSGYGYNIKSKAEENFLADSTKQLESNVPYYGHQHLLQESPYNKDYIDSKRYGDTVSQTSNYLSQVTNSYQDSTQPTGNIQQNLPRPPNSLPTDISSILKLNDIPYHVTQGLTKDSFRLQNSNFDQSNIPSQLPPRLNQNMGSHQIDASNNVLNKYMLNKQPLNYNSDSDSQSNLLSTINGMRVANPFNVDLKLVAEMLKNKPLVDESHMLPYRDQYSKPVHPMKLDLSQLQQYLLKNENYGNVASLGDGLGAYSSNPYFDMYGSGRYPYQGVKYSRSQEEEETIIPIADASNTHPIGAVIEQDDSVSEREVSTGAELTGNAEEGVISSNFEDSVVKRPFGNKLKRERNRHPNSILSGHHSFPRRYPKSDMREPYPLLKPPPQHLSRIRNKLIKDRRSRRRRINKPKITRILKTEALFEANSTPEINNDADESSVSVLLKPPPPMLEAKADVIDDKEFKEEEKKS